VHLQGFRRPNGQSFRSNTQVRTAVPPVESPALSGQGGDKIAGTTGLFAFISLWGTRWHSGRIKSLGGRFFKTPKGLLLIILVLLVAVAAPHEGLRVALPGLLAACGASGLLDMVILRRRKNAWEFPGGAILTAVIVAMVLRAQEPWYVVTITAVIAVLSKYIVRSHSANVFNPAALGIVITFYIFHTGQSWWGALPEVSPWAVALLLMAGVFIADRVNKLPLVLVFLGLHFLLFTITAFVGNPRSVAEIFRAPDLQAALYFAFIILTDPPTSPAKYPDQLIFGAIVAAVSFVVFEWFGVVYFLLAGVLAGNVWEASRRVSRRRKRSASSHAALTLS
jgi:Na+-translocating ferredoxin:NAD+ oxidoreductase RnfD subunit